ncbi:unnamed protein product, partial [Rotaria sp. Silwood1]
MKYPLHTFSITLDPYNEDDPTSLISSIMSHNDLLKFEFNGNNENLNQIQWPIQC